MALCAPFSFVPVALAASMGGGKRNISLCCPDKRGVRAHKEERYEDDCDRALRNGPKTAIFVAEFTHERRRPMRIPVLALPDSAIYCETSFLYAIGKIPWTGAFSTRLAGLVAFVFIRFRFTVLHGRSPSVMSISPRTRVWLI